MQADLCTEEEITLQVLPGLIGLYSKNLPSANYLTASSLALLTRNSSIDASSAIPVLVQMLIGKCISSFSVLLSSMLTLLYRGVCGGNQRVRRRCALQSFL